MNAAREGLAWRLDRTRVHRRRRPLGHAGAVKCQSCGRNSDYAARRRGGRACPGCGVEFLLEPKDAMNELRLTDGRLLAAVRRASGKGTLDYLPHQLAGALGVLTPRLREPVALDKLHRSLLGLHPRGGLELKGMLRAEPVAPGELVQPRGPHPPRQPAIVVCGDGAVARFLVVNGLVDELGLWVVDSAAALDQVLRGAAGAPIPPVLTLADATVAGLRSRVDTWRVTAAHGLDPARAVALDAAQAAAIKPRSFRRSRLGRSWRRELDALARHLGPQAGDEPWASELAWLGAGHWLPLVSVPGAWLANAVRRASPAAAAERRAARQVGFLTLPEP